jgi:uncharacterized membrane protein (DUF4010 family)
LIITALMSNLVFKAAAVAMLGNQKLFRYIVVVFGMVLATGGLLLAGSSLWPPQGGTP